MMVGGFVEVSLQLVAVIERIRPCLRQPGIRDPSAVPRPVIGGFLCHLNVLPIVKHGLATGTDQVGIRDGDGEDHGARIEMLED
jgi:hypothetical protein